MNRAILYISGPYSPGHGRTVAENIAVARAHAVVARKRGWMPFTPHLNTAGFEADCPNVSHQDWLDGDLAIIRRLDPYVDAMLLLPGWTKSDGALQEYQVASRRGLEIIGPVDSPECIPPPGGRCTGPIQVRGSARREVED